jgi:hypothetical protein
MPYQAANLFSSLDNATTVYIHAIWNPSVEVKEAFVILVVIVSCFVICGSGKGYRKKQSLDNALAFEGISPV